MTARLVRKQYCPVCNRFLGAMKTPVDLGVGQVSARLQCRTCRKWRWYDVVSGGDVDEPEAV